MHLELHAFPHSSCSFWKQPLPNTLTRKPNALCRMPSYDTYWYTYTKPLCWLPRLLHCRYLSHSFEETAKGGPYTEHMNQSCPRITPPACRGERTQDRTSKQLRNRETTEGSKEMCFLSLSYSFLLLLLTSVIVHCSAGQHPSANGKDL